MIEVYRFVDNGFVLAGAVNTPSSAASWAKQEKIFVHQDGQYIDIGTAKWCKGCRKWYPSPVVSRSKCKSCRDTDSDGEWIVLWLALFSEVPEDKHPRVPTWRQLKARYSKGVCDLCGGKNRLKFALKDASTLEIQLLCEGCREAITGGN